MSKERYDQIIDEAYENYKKDQNGIIGSDWTYRLSTPSGHDLFRLYTKEEFVEKCKKDPKFWSEWSLSEKWGLKIKERELNYKERWFLAYNETFDEWYERLWKNNEFHIPGCDLEDRWTADGIPTKLITLTYNNETIEVYE